MNKLELIQQQVAAHFSAKEAWKNRAPDHVHASVINGYNPSQDAAMTLLRDLLPLLELSVYLESYDIKTYDMDVITDKVSKLQTEIARLTEEVE